jgi:ATP-dependent RNA helicase DHX57
MRPPSTFPACNNLSNPFITAVHSGLTDIKRRWVEEKAIKEGGWPASVVRKCTEDEECIEKWDRLLVSLGQKLLGREIDTDSISSEATTPYEMKEEEFEAFGGQLAEPGHLVVQLFSTPIAVHVLFSDEGCYPRPGYIPIYLTSATIPSYIRLHLVSRFLEIMALQPDLQDHEGFCTAVMRIFEGEWAVIEDHGPPDMSTVLRHIVAPRRKFIRAPEERTLDKPPISKMQFQETACNCSRRRNQAALYGDAKRHHGGNIPLQSI